MRPFLKNTLKVFLLSIVLFIIFSIASVAAGLSAVTQKINPGSAAVSLFIVCSLISAAVSYPVIRSKWYGWKLVLTIFCVMFGIMTFLTQVETIVFLNYLVDIISKDMIPKLFLQGAIIAALFSPLAVLIHGKLKKVSETDEAEESRLKMSWKQWALRLILISILYVVIYFLFGYFVFVKLAGDSFGQYYKDLKVPEWMILFQMGRALIWTALTIPVIKMMKGNWWETGLAVSLLYSILMGSLLLIPSGIMPDNIRLSHFVELTTSNFVFGWVVVWLLNIKKINMNEIHQVPKIEAS